MIIKNAFEKIIQIEKKKQMPEYEGLLKTVYATGFVDINGVTAVNSLHSKSLQTSKFVLGDKMGVLHLMDTSRKIVLDKKNIFDGHRIDSISSASIAWVDTHLCTIAVTARGVPDIKIMCNKISDNKFYHHYTISGIDPAITNENKGNPETSYLNFPYKITVSKDCLFLLVTTYGGVVYLLRLPDPINPSKLDDNAPPAAASEGVSQASNTEPSVSNFIKSDIDKIEHKVLDFHKLVLQKIDAKQLPKQFKDPFEHPPPLKEEEPVVADPKAKKTGKEVAKEVEEPSPELDDHSGPKYNYKIGKAKVDGDKGDAGLLYRTKGPVPHAYFVRSVY